jgi:sulfatase modifying factor 1
MQTQSNQLTQEEHQDRYLLKIQELRDLFKLADISEQEIINKIENIKAWGIWHGIQQIELNTEILLHISRDLKTLYQKIWLISSESEWENQYDLLSEQTRSLFDWIEVLNDWDLRQLSKLKYDDFCLYLANTNPIYLDDLTEKYKQYMQEQYFFVDQPKTYFMSWEQVLTTHQEKIIYRQKKRVLNNEFFMLYCPMEIKKSYNQTRYPLEPSKGFWIGETQVTQSLWFSVMYSNPSYFHKPLPNQYPVESITLYDAMMFCNRLSELENLNPCYQLSKMETESGHVISAMVHFNPHINGYQLPTNELWTYAAYANQKLIYGASNSLDEIAWYSENSAVGYGCKTHEVKLKQPNQWGIYDMSGNVWEWTVVMKSNQYSHGTLKGGSCGSFPNDCKPSNDCDHPAGNRYLNQGLRVILRQAIAFDPFSL